MVSPKNLWRRVKFKKLSPLEKLLYIYLATQDSITVLGKVEVERKDIKGLTGCPSFSIIKDLLKKLRDEDYIYFYFSSKILTVIIRDHWHTLARSKRNIQKGVKEGREAQGKLRSLYLKLYTKEDFETKYEFIPPTPEQVTEYALKKGYIVDGKTFIEHYASNDWYNIRGKKVRNWKATCDKVWCREENALKIHKNAPEGFEYFYITTEEGERIYPEDWKDGEPTHSEFLYGVLLKEKFNQINVQNRS